MNDITAKENGNMNKITIVKQLTDMAEGFGWNISADIIDKVLSFSSFKVYSKGEILIRIGDKATNSGIVLSGAVRSFYIDEDGNDISQFFATRGNLCMDSGMFGFDESCASWESLEETTIMVFNAKLMKQLIMSNESLKECWIEALESSMRYKIYRENGLLVESATERYLEFRKRYPQLCEKIPQQYIATYLGIKPESLSRIKSSLKEKK